ncbi:hypothetical protein LSAT2_030347 [Lamellibrachia satsuma]|nr:hypothetical protein LSAT2_030347 [Lamellibrachia satsuma]
MESAKSDTGNPECVDQQHLSKKVVNGDATTILDKTHARLNGDCLDGKNSRHGSPLLNGSDDTVTESSGGKEKSETELKGHKKTNGKTDSDNKAFLDVASQEKDVGEEDVLEVTGGASECILVDDDKTESSHPDVEADNSEVSMDSGNIVVEPKQAANVNGGSIKSDGDHLDDISNKDINTKYVDSTDVTKLIDDDSEEDNGSSSKDVTNVDDGDSSRDVITLDEADSNSSRDVTKLNDGNISRDVITLDEADSSITSRDVTNLDESDSSSRDVSKLDNGDSSSRDVSKIDDGDSSSRDVSKIDDGDSSSRDVSKLDDGDSSSRDVSKLNDGDNSSRDISKFDNGDSRQDGAKSTDTNKAKLPNKASSYDVSLDDDDSNIADVTKTRSQYTNVAGQDKKNHKEPVKKDAVLSTIATKISNVVTNKKQPVANKVETMNISQKSRAVASSSKIMMKDVTPLRSAPSMTTLVSKPSHSSPSLAAKGHLTSMQLRPMSSLLYDLGLNLTKEQVYKDLIRIQTRKRSKNRLTDKEIQQLNKLKDAHKNLSKKNTRFHFTTETCHRCGFKTDSENTMAYHNEFLETDEAGDSLCGLCNLKLPQSTQDVSKQFVHHMRTVHKRHPRVYTQLLQFTCNLCLFETNLKVVLGKHMKKCERNFKLNRNLEPGPADCDIPMKLPRYGAPMLTETLARRPSSQAAHGSGTVGEHLRKRRENVTIHPPYQPTGAYRALTQARPSVSSTSAINSMQSLLAHTSAPIGSMPQQLVQVGGRLYNLINQNGQTLLTPITATQLPVISTVSRQMTITPQPRLPGVVNAAQPTALGMPSRSSSDTTIGIRSQFSPESVVAKNGKNVSDKNSSVAPANSKCSTSPSTAPKFEICEICGGFVKDRDSLRIHFYYAHKVEIQRDAFMHKKGQLMCDLCPKRFWTYQGLAKHRQGQHKLMHEENFRCFLCVKSNITDMLTHLNNCHGITRDTLFRRTVCPCCGQNFVNPKSLEHHMRLAHSAMFKDADKRDVPTRAMPSRLYENMALSDKTNTVPTCLKCNVLFETTDAFLKHCEQLHTYKCSRCQQKWSSLEFLQKHFTTVHGLEKEPCQLCSESVVIGRPFIHHMKRRHLKHVSVSVPRLSEEKFNFYMAKRRKLSS